MTAGALAEAQPGARREAPHAAAVPPMAVHGPRSPTQAAQRGRTPPGRDGGHQHEPQREELKLLAEWGDLRGKSMSG